MEPVMKARIFFIASGLAIAALAVLAGCTGDTGEKNLLPAEADNATPVSPATTPQEVGQSPPGPDVILTVNSAQKVAMIQGTGPDNGIWLIIDLSAENRGKPGGIALKQSAMVLSDPVSGQQFRPVQKNMHFIDPWKDGIVEMNATKRGEILFITGNSPDSYELTLNNPDGRPISRTVVNTTRNREYVHTISGTTKSLSDSQNFSAVVDQLTTPKKTLEYMADTFIFEKHGSLIAYTPKDFFRIRKGDCKDYAAFFSYVIAEHGYYAEMVSLKFSSSGHTVTLFRDEDGQMKYQSSDKMNGFRNVSSLEDLIKSESIRLGDSVVRVKVFPPGSVNMCTSESGEC